MGINAVKQPTQVILNTSQLCWLRGTFVQQEGALRAICWSHSACRREAAKEESEGIHVIYHVSIRLSPDQQITEVKNPRRLLQRVRSETHVVSFPICSPPPNTRCASRCRSAV